MLAKGIYIAITIEIAAAITLKNIEESANPSPKTSYL